MSQLDRVTRLLLNHQIPKAKNEDDVRYIVYLFRLTCSLPSVRSVMPFALLIPFEINPVWSDFNV